MKRALVILHSKNMALPDGVREATLRIEGGVITGVTEGRESDGPTGGGGERLPESEEGILPGGPRVSGMEDGGEWVDVGDMVVMPGVIDPHVHINEPGRTDWEGFDTATRSALAGGLTTVVDMPLNSSPVTTTVEAFDKKLAAADGQLHCNCGFWGGLVPGNEREIVPLIKKGVLGFKAFLTHSGIDEFPNVTEEDLRKAMPVIARYGLPLLVHCELEGARKSDGRPIKRGAAGPMEWADRRAYRNYLSSRPAKWEDDAIALMIRLCEEYGCRTHIVHLSSAGSIEPIKRAKEKGLPLTVETAQHYLYFDAERIGDGQTVFKCAPPIRGSDNNERIWQALKDGVIDFVATDHSPAPPALKEIESGDFMRAWGGISSMQFALSALWTAGRKRGVIPGDLVKWCCEGPAKLIGGSEGAVTGGSNSSRIGGSKGSLTDEIGRRGKIAAGYVADLVVWDPEGSCRVTKEGIHHKHKLTPYLGEQLYGVVEQTWLGGVRVFDKGVFTGLNRGKIITR